jgi:hypothetical protein
MQQFTVWLGRHGSTLQHLSLDLEAIKSGRQELGQSSAQSCTSPWDFLNPFLNPFRREYFPVPELGGLTQLTSLQLRNLTSVEYRQLAGLPQLRCLDLTYCHGYLCNSDIDHFLSCLPHLTSLDLRSSGISAENLASCPSLPPLQELKLSMYLSGRGGKFSTLGRLPCTSLEVTFFEHAAIREFVAWGMREQGKQCLGRLTSLILNSMNPGAASVGSPDQSQALLLCLAGAATNLRHLQLPDDKEGMDDVNLLSSLTQLTSLRCFYSGAADADVVSPLAALPNLQLLTVAGLYEPQTVALKDAAAAGGLLSCLKELKMFSLRNSSGEKYLGVLGGV